MPSGIQLDWLTLGMIVAAVVVLNLVILAAFGLILRARLRREHVALEARMDKRIEAQLNPVVGRVCTLDEHAKRRNEAISARIKTVIERIDAVNGRSTEELKEILESVCVLASVLASLDLRQARRIDRLESRLAELKRENHE